MSKLEQIILKASIRRAKSIDVFIEETIEKERKPRWYNFYNIFQPQITLVWKGDVLSIKKGNKTLSKAEFTIKINTNE